MPDLCLCRLVVSSAHKDVRRFVREARPARDSSEAWRGDGAPVALSFQRLMPIVEDQNASDIYGTPWHEPEEVTRSHVERVTSSRARVTYGFVTKWAEPHLLIRDVSRRYPSLDFVVGAVAPAVDEANSWYFRAGRGRNWKMGGRERNRIRSEAYRRNGITDPNDADLWDDVVADHALMRRWWRAGRPRECEPFVVDGG